MKFTAVILALCAMCASAFVAPATVGECNDSNDKCLTAHVCLDACAFLPVLVHA